MKKALNKLLVIIGVLTLCEGAAYAQQNPITCLNGIQPTAIGCAGSCIFIQNQSGTPQGLDSCFQYYYWSMPGGSPSTYSYYQVPCVTYTTPGTYTVTLWGAGEPIDPDTNSNYVQCIVTVYGAPDASFSGPSSLCINEAYNASLNSPSSLTTSVSWDMGDGSFFPNWPNSSINYAYAQPGTYWVTACVVDSCGSACDSQLVTVLAPQPRFTHDASCQTICFHPDTTCIDQVISHLWSFGANNATSTLEQPCYTYPLTGGPFTVTHTITTSAGTYSYTDVVTPPGPPQPIISGLQVNNCGSGYFNYQVQPCQPGIVYTWSVNGGSIVNNNGCNVDITWANSGGYVIITAWDSVGDCNGYDTLLIPPCCYPSGNYIFINNDTASKVLQNPAFSQYLTGNVFSAPQQIIINGIFVIDTDFTFYNSLVSMGAEAIVEVQSGQLFTIDSTTFGGGKCGYMWDGIHVSDPTAMVKIVRHSTVTQAKRAVYSTNGGNYLIESSNMRNNVRCVVVEQYTNTHQGRITGSLLNMQGTFLQSFIPLPIGYTKTVCAIEIENNSQITIGDASQPALRNRFNNVLVGIRSKNSRTTVVNAEFTNFNPSNVQAFVPDAGTGIVSIGGKSTNNYLASLTVGGTGNAPCLFDNMKTAINISQRSNNYIYNNTIRKVSIYGIRVFNADAYGIDISGNTITNSGNVAFNTGIYLAECYNATVNINNNTINQTAVQPLQNGVGISVSLASPSSMTMNVMNNNISRVKTGCWFINLTGPSNVWVKGNTVKFFKPNSFYTTVHYGVRLENCVTLIVDSNTVTKNGSNPNAGMVSFLRGISIENSPGSLVINNTLTRLGSGLFGFEISSFSTLACNTMDRCYNGVFFTGSQFTNNACDIGNQVVDPNNTPAATGNTWIANQGQFQIDGDVAPAIVWRWDVSSPSNGATNVTLNWINYNACNTFFALSPAVIERDKQVGTLLRNAADTAISTEQRYQVQRYAHRKLHQNPSWLILGAPDDTVYQNFYNSYDPTNLGALRQIEVGVDADSAQVVSGICSNLTCSNLIEHNAKEVYTIYAATWMNGIASFSPADSATLLSIANMDPVEGGTAVYSARVMLDLPVDYFGGNTQRVSQQGVEQHEATFIRVFPNPASEYVQLDMVSEDSQNAQVEIVDLHGKVVLSQQLSSDQSSHLIKTSTLTEGVYLLRIIADGVEIEGQRLVIAR